MIERVINRKNMHLAYRHVMQNLRAPIVINGVLTKRRKGIPQGSPLSPVLSNIMLHELDKELEKKEWKYVRFADDFSIYAKTASQAKKAGNAIFLFLKNTLKLPINREKSGIRKPVQFQILGYRFVPTYQKGTKGKYQMVVSKKGWKTLRRENQSHHQKNRSEQSGGAHRQTEGSAERLGELLPHGKHGREAQRPGRVGKEPPALLHLA